MEKVVISMKIHKGVNKSYDDSMTNRLTKIISSVRKIKSWQRHNCFFHLVPYTFFDRRYVSSLVMKDKELNLEDVKDPHTLGWVSYILLVQFLYIDSTEEVVSLFEVRLQRLWVDMREECDSFLTSKREVWEISRNTWNYIVTNNKKSNNKFIEFYTKINVCKFGSLSVLMILFLI